VDETVTDSAQRAPRAQFGPDRRLVALGGIATLVAAGLAIASSDGAQRLLLGVAAVLLGAYTAIDLIFWPRLIVDADGLTLRTPTARTRVPWSEQPIVRVDERGRLGLTSRTLEIDHGSLLVVLSRRTLGSDPGEVFDLIQAFRPARGD
jgi:hypothetical protein